MQRNFQLGDLVFYIGPPILKPQIWELIVINNNGIVNLEEMAIIVENNVENKISTLFFQICQLKIEDILHKDLRLVS